MPSPHQPSENYSFGGASFSASPERALALLVERGILILDDDRHNLEAVASVCTDFFDIPKARVACVHARPGMSLREIIGETEGHFRHAITSSGTSFGGLITDFHLSPTITSLEVWSAVDASFASTSYQGLWRQTARVLMTASVDETAITQAESAGLIDSHIRKPFTLSDLQRALVDSIFRRLP